MSRLLRALALGLIALLGIAGCTASSGSSSNQTPTAPGGSSGALTGRVTVFAAASLKESFTNIGSDFTAAHPGTEVVFNFGASSTLATQIVAGAPADVFASASGKNMTQVVDAKAATNPLPFATNQLELAVPAANPAHLRVPADLAKSGVKLAVCQEAVPCGAAATKFLSKAALTVTPVTREADVKAVLTKVTLGEVDAGIVYVTDVRAAGDKVIGIEIPANLNETLSYPIATISASQNPALASAFTAYVRSDAGAAVLATHGFGRP